MTRKQIQNNLSKNDNLIDVSCNVSFKAKISPKVKDFLATTTEAGKTVIKVGQRLLPILILLGTISTSCAPKHSDPNLPKPPVSESAQKLRQ